ncbi:hypothetical protein U14_01516 [Candidatus Moduliflexus flocculans]|uniref:Type I restriction enzyme R protein N-terminal domain-containing protein n=1 Tax=Candidatus Moduliflexus flocculans TaxID=1499966 RepID=A0A0S6VSG2_9BACT|nr:hypothetical protein U14_01516 [Candidatus Moduliflexus flocculans]
MSYSDFKTIDDILAKFDVTISSGDSLFADVPDIPASPELAKMLDTTVPLALNINTEKARSELIIAPLLVEVRNLLERKISLFSGIDFSVDVSRNLNGFCDFILSYSRDQAFLQTPVICIVEAKNENLKSGYAQCMAEMLAAQMYNEQKAHPVSWILGVVTTGSNWKFLTLEGAKFSIDFDEYMIMQVAKILGIFVEGVHHIVRAGA